MINFACVFYGLKYDIDYVRKLYNMVQRNTTVPHKFICFTDNTQCLSSSNPLKSKNIEFRQFARHDFDGWFNKLQLFSPQSNLEGPTLYMDLDIVITKNIDCFFNYGEDHNFVGMNDFNPTSGQFNSSIMKFDNKQASKLIWEPYIKERSKYRMHGDQNIITALIKNHNDTISFPNEWTQAYKWLNRKGERYHIDKMTYEEDTNAKVCVFHGNPNPHESTQLWVKNHWY